MNKEKVFGFLKSGLGLLCCALVLTLVLAFFGMLVNTSGGRVKKVTADMDANYAEWYGNATVKPLRVSTLGDVNAKLSGYVYMPRGVSASNPAPAVCLTHGYLNSKEYVEPFAIELARRGYVVFCYDQYDHGTSTWDTPAAFQFYVWSAYDAVQFMYHQDYVLKAADGTGMIGVTGHSMGGFSSEIATFFDQMDVLMTATKQKVVATLPMGADFRYVDFYASPYSGGLYTTIAASYGNRSCGALAAEFDEFFFDNSGNGAGTVIKKNYLADTKGLALLGLTGQVSEADNKTFYKVNPLDGVAYTDQASAAAGYGERIIYQVKGDHPYNTWSPEAVGDVCDFYNHAFQYQASL
ncbi:MAG: lysophospholipase, partial [Gammaproteobacteria bacterium]|nr:lysophospholipase [Gammaproteobacteria bacterium]